MANANGPDDLGTILVRDIMTRDVVTVRPDTTLEEVARAMLDRSVGCIPVVDERGGLLGVITEADFTGKRQGFPFSAFRAPQLFGEWVPAEGVERLYQEARRRKARDLMSTEVVTVDEDMPVSEVVNLMVDRGFHRLPVIRDGVVSGIVTRHDLLRLMVAPQGGDPERPNR